MIATFYIKATEGCNLSCSHCSNAGNSLRTGELDPARIFNFLKSLESTFSQGHFILTGGEPLLGNLQKIKEFYNGNVFFKKRTYSLQSNLSFKISDKQMEIINLVSPDSGLGTSYDGTIRFNDKQKKQWEDNIKMLSTDREITVQVSLNEEILNTNPKELLDYFSSLGIRYVNFYQITPSGNAKTLEPIRKEKRDSWLSAMLDVTIKHRLHEKIGNMLFDSLVKSVIGNKPTATRTRQCQKRFFTINLDGSVKGCQNTDTHWGYLENDILRSPQRIYDIARESCIPKECLACDMLKYCNGECHLLKGCSGYYSILKRISISPFDYEDLLIRGNNEFN